MPRIDLSVKIGLYQRSNIKTHLKVDMDSFSQDIITLIYLITSATILGYLCGSISSAILVCRIIGLPDPRTKGSLNSGATNVLRIGGKKAAIATLIGDILKGIIPLIIIQSTVGYLELGRLSEHVLPLCMGMGGFAAVLGHMWPIFFKFQGGKGVATALGVTHALSLPLGMAFDATWLLVALISRYSSLAAMIAFMMTPIAAYWIIPPAAPYLAAISLLVLYKHKENYQRLIKGEESRLGTKI